ncbi:hypothetical protein COY25_02105 [Candidatus Uhrbacteria bacterium CG_4_10_14_0_2_um_filter_41_7]|uniref:Uncharacterized protein n=1 Tax=Candidatus Uhrbacteria bacterium CG_4_9_14_3_um_filter_41_35 TaxID=1975034 RepID=A0A2M7XF76_9BACT|nr:MAG: hypothetical protein COV92_00275 [Candidatus Uhrbacteria bacterium CG11_big_fil_rev_8_21_14_0_20_41_9]PIZ54448.1 MAG: hypothetical protein COY25_02105 [Candidatus Uhrbacteria bacterium CG_4_10_14_0_2_um_filter_41_7]PJA46523.1 MAG: hypothetical protein CO173_02035 [Candidatus Uhrbacteria bacterium CG_4_9_14_3_um_filter_41_35]
MQNIQQLLNSKIIWSALIFSFVTLLATSLYLKNVTQSAQPTEAELTSSNQELFSRVADYANLRSDIKTEYLRCRNLISDHVDEESNFDIDYCYEYIKWTDSLTVKVF